MESATRLNNILILCTGNSCRSQIAGGLLKSLLPKVGVYSAGIETHGINPKAIRVMDEIEIDLRSNTSNHIEEYIDMNFDHIITVCDHAAKNCPHFPSNAQRHHFNFPDPAKANGNEEEILNEFRSVRHLIKESLEKFVAKHY